MKLIPIDERAVSMIEKAFFSLIPAGSSSRAVAMANDSMVSSVGVISSYSVI